MAYGYVLPQTEAPDPADVVRLARAAEEAGFSYVVLYDHVVGVDRSSHPGFEGPYDAGDPFHEPLVMLGHLAAHVALELWTGVLVLPQRQTVLVAKQAAQVDLVSGGRLRLGVGVGWNAAEYAALGERFSDRGARYEEQVALLRRLWCEEVVSFEGRWHHLDGVGILPLPVQRPIPLWMGGAPLPAVMDRIGRLGDGWIALTPPGRGFEEGWEQVRRSAEAAGRDPDSVGIAGVLQPGPELSPERLARQAERWRSAGARYLSVSSMRGGRDLQGHLRFVEEVAGLLLR
jgi:probable F420-dependent oxidoreductase